MLGVIDLLLSVAEISLSSAANLPCSWQQRLTVNCSNKVSALFTTLVTSESAGDAMQLLSAGDHSQ